MMEINTKYMKDIMLLHLISAFVRLCVCHAQKCVIFTKLNASTRKQIAHSLSLLLIVQESQDPVIIYQKPNINGLKSKHFKPNIILFRLNPNVCHYYYIHSHSLRITVSVFVAYEFLFISLFPFRFLF